MTVIRYGKGRGSVELSGELKALVETLLEEAAPVAVSALKAELEPIAAQARKKWPTRQPRYGKSQDSKGKIETGIRVIPPATIEGYISNNAEYAWAIKAGRQSDTPVSSGQRVADVLIWQPVKKRSSTVAKKIADEMARKARKAK